MEGGIPRRAGPRGMDYLDRFIERAESDGDATLWKFCDDDGRVFRTETMRSTLAEVENLSGFLRDRCSLSPGDRALLVYPPGIDFAHALLACLYAGVVPVPVYPPNPIDPAPSLLGLHHIAADCGASVALTTRLYSRARRVGQLRGLVDRRGPSWPELRWYKTDGLRRRAFRPARATGVSPGDVALLQYTSGSTSAPRGVELTHANIDHQVAFNRRAMRLHNGALLVGWLPQYHDFGLLSILNSVVGHGCIIGMSPLSFIKRPAMWFELVAEHRATHVAAPNFAFELMLRKTTPAQRSTMDLSSIEMCMSAAEPIRPQTVKAFLEAFGECGLRPEAFCPAYGLAEHTVGVTIQGRGLVTVDRRRLELDRAVDRSTNGGETLTLVGCGPPEDDVVVRIVDTETREELGANRVGEIWVDSPSKARGYWGQPEKSEETFRARLARDDGRGYLRTGDLGFLHEGELYVCGRHKDLLILRGRNVYPQDIEETAQRGCSLIRPGLVVATSAYQSAGAGDGAGEERLVIVAECRSDGGGPIPPAMLRSEAEAISRAVLSMHAVRAAEVVWIGKGALPKTTSGKVQRFRTQQALRDDELPILMRWRDPAAAEDVPSEAWTSPATEPEAAPQTAEAREQDAADGSGLAGHDEAAALALEQTIWNLLRERPELSLPDSIPRHVPFRELGLDSVVAVETGAKLAEIVGRPLQATVLFENPTIASLARYLADPERARTSTVERAEPDAPIALVAMGCRFPGGVTTPEELWAVLDGAIDTITEVPESRRPGHKGAAHADAPRFGGFLADVAHFDADLFSISPGEATYLDPQQRLLLEVAWEALERSGRAPDRMEGSRTAVFVGLSTTDWAERTLASGDPERLDAWAVTGISPSIAAGRISHRLGLQGPALTIDTACSSSLVAIHLAAQSLRDRECDLALAGGVNVITSEAGSIALQKMGALSPTGRCRTFDASADGYVRSEGCGLVVLERLDDALANGDPVLAVVRGSAINQDGRSFGLTAPNALAQAAVMEEALRRSDLAPTDVDAVECHGTGTPLGDPIEVGSIASIYGQGRDGKEPVHLLAAKAKLGHTEAAAGVAGFMEAALSVAHGRLPGNPHLRTSNPRVRWDDLPLAPTRSTIAWPEVDRPRRVAVSSFGFSGTNAHLILEQSPEREMPDADEAPPLVPLVLSARTDEALRAQGARWASWLQANPRVAWLDVAYTAANARTHFPCRATIRADETAGAAALLAALAEGKARAGLDRSTAPETPGGLAVLFSGQGSQYPGMGRDLYEASAPFREALDEAFTALDRHLRRPLRSVMWAEPGTDEAALLDQTEYTQPALFALEVALFRQWEALGLRVDALLGHSIGELVAAHVGGVLSLPDAARLVCARGRLMMTCPGGGAMIAVEATEEELAPHLEAHRGSVDVAGDNGRKGTVLSGDEAAVLAVAAALEKQGTKTTRLSVSHAFHSAHMEPILEELAAEAGACTFARPTLPIISNVSGAKATAAELGTPQYWAQHARRPVRFAAGMMTLHELGIRTYVECGPRAVLGAMGEACLPKDAGATFIGSLAKGRDDRQQLTRAVASVYLSGQPLGWARAFAGTGATLVPLPTYAFSRRRYWLEPARGPAAQPASTSRAKHPLLDRTWVAGERLVFEGQLSASRYPSLRGHRLGEHVVASVTTMLELARGAGGDDAEICDVELQRPLILDGGAGGVQVVLDSMQRESGEVCLYSIPDDLEGELVRLGGARLQRHRPGADDIRDVGALLAALPGEGAVERLGQSFESTGVYLSSSPYLSQARFGAGACLLRFDTRGELNDRWSRHLGILDGAVLALVGTAGPDEATRPRTPVGVSRFWSSEPCGETTWFHAQRRGDGEGTRLRGDVAILAHDGRVIGGLEGLTLEAVDPVRAVQAVLAQGHPAELGPARRQEVASEPGCVVLTGGEERAVTGIGHWLRREPGVREVVWLTTATPSTFGTTELARARVVAVGVDGTAQSIGEWLSRSSERRVRSVIHLIVRSGAGGGVEKSVEESVEALWAAHQATTEAPIERFLVGMAPELERGHADLHAFVDGLVSFRKERGSVAEKVQLQWSGGERRSAAGAAAGTETARRDGEPAASQGIRVGDVQAFLREQAALVLGKAVGDVPVDRPLQELGFDSLMAVEYRNIVSKALDRKIEPTVVYDHPTIQALAAYLDDGSSSRQTVASVASTGTDEPIAVVGMSCRFPGHANDLPSYWRLLHDGVDAITEIPKTRWDVDALYDPDPEALGKMTTRSGGFIDDVDRFDASFFFISPREAEHLDPQQRLLLELSWEALEHAGILPESLMETSAAVFVGLLSNDYGALTGRSLESVSGYSVSGNTGSIASGRISYFLGTRGPSLTVDTGCSSSLVCVHLGCQALRSGETDLALAGAASLILAPSLHVGFSRLQGLAADGRCKTFSNAADGMGWGEGGGMVVLKRLADAQRDGDRILGVIRGVAVNQDGRSNGLTAPNGPSQVAVIRAALQQARLDATDIDYVEAHGTGTTLGDPIELSSLVNAFAEGRQRTLHVGSVKTNIGHTQAAAGIAGLIKVLLGLRNDVIPPHLNCHTRTPHVEWPTFLDVPTAPVAWARRNGPRRAGVSSFGLSGTNVHVVVEEAPAKEPRREASRALGPLPLVLSGHDEGAVREQAGRWADWLEAHPDVPWSDVLHTANLHRPRLRFGASVRAGERGATLEALRALAAGTPHPSVTTGNARDHRRRVFVFPGQGSQWTGMGKELLVHSKPFAAAVAACDAALAPFTGWSMRAVLAGESGDGVPPLERVDVVQPALFTMAVGLAAMWRSLGIEPDAVVGHSQGEIAAAVVAGALGLEDGARVVATRSLRVRELAGSGAMASVSLPADELRARIAPWGDALSVGVVNTRTSAVVSGEEKAVTELLAALEPEDIFCKRIEVDYASHSRQVDPILDAIARDLAGLTPREPRIPFYSTVTGARIEGADLDAAYWCKNLREPVRLDLALHELLAAGHDVFVEMSPHPLLTLPLSNAGEQPVLVVGSLQRGEGRAADVYEKLGRLHVAGHGVDWARHFEGVEASLIDLPTYAFQRQRYWLPVVNAASDVVAAGLSPADHPLLGAATPLADSGAFVSTAQISTSRAAWLEDHAVFDTVLFPGAGFVDLALATARCLDERTLHNLTITSPLTLPSREAVRLQITLQAADVAGRRALSIHSRPAEASDDVTWTLHAMGWLNESAGDSLERVEELGEWPPAGAEPVDVSDLYARLDEAGMHYGPSFRGLVEGWRSEGRLYARVVLPHDLVGSVDGYVIHPALLDAALHTIALASVNGASAAAEPANDDRPEGEVPGRGVFLPFEWSDVTVHAAGATELRVRVDLDGAHSADGTGAGATDIGGRALLADGTGKPVLTIGRIGLRRATAADIKVALRRSVRHLYRVEWQPLALRSNVQERPAEARVLGRGRLAELLEVPVVDDLGAVTPFPGRLWLDATGPAPLDTPFVAGDDVVQSSRRDTARALAWVQAWLADDRWANSELICVTRGAVWTGPGDSVDGLAHAPLWGLLRTARNEHPDRTLRAVDVGPESINAERIQRLGDVHDEPELARRGSRLLVPRLRAVPRREDDAPEIRITPAALGTALITGGTGDLGRSLARHLIVEHGVRHLVLTSRRGMEAEGSDELVAELRAAGAETVTIAACDVTNRDALAAVIDAIDAGRPLGAVFHLAGVLRDAVVTTLTAEQLHDVLAPKIDGAWALHELTRERDLGQMVFYSSVAGTIGTPGQANYAAANAFLDALAAHRRERGLPGSSLAWGFWAPTGDGMTSHLEAADVARLRRQGMIQMEVPDGLALLDETLRRDGPTWTPAAIDLARIERQIDSGLPAPSVLRELVRPRLRRAAQQAEEALAFRRRMTALDVEQRRAALLDVVRAEVSLVLGLRDAQSVEVDTALRDMGFDSLMAVELRNRLSVLAGTTLPAMLAMDYPTVEKLSRKLAEDYFNDVVEAAKNTRGLRTSDVDLALSRLRGADLVDPLRNAGLLESVVELLGEISLREESRSGDTSDIIDTDQAMRLVATMDSDSIDAKLNSILDEST